MNIALIAADLVPNNLGGAEKHVVEVVKRLSKKHKFTIFVGPNTAIQKEFPNTVKIIPIQYPKIPNLYGLAYITWGYFQISKNISREKIDLLWAKQSFPQATLAALVKKKYKIPLYTTVQNPRLHLEELVIKGFVKPFHKLFASFLTPLITWSLIQSDLVAAVSTYSAQLAKQLGVKKVVIIPNGVNPDKFTIRKRKKTKQLRLLTNSSLIPRNGIDVLISAVSQLPKTLDWQLQIAGDGPEFNNLKLQVSKLKLQRKIKFLGRVENHKISALLSQADIFIRPSRKEGFGISFIEAMAAGIPVIATPVGGITDFIKNEKTGLLVETENPQAVAQAIIRLKNDKKLYRILQKNAEKLVTNKYNWDKIANEVKKALKSIS